MKRYVKTSLLIVGAVVIASTSLRARAAVVTAPGITAGNFVDLSYEGGTDFDGDTVPESGGIDVEIAHDAFDTGNDPVTLIVDDEPGDADFSTLAFEAVVFNFTFTDWQGYIVTLGGGATWNETNVVFFPADPENQQRSFTVEVNPSQTTATISFGDLVIDDGSTSAGFDIGVPNLDPQPDAGNDWFINAPTGFGNGSTTFTMTLTPIAPEPTSLGLLVGLGALIVRRRR